MAVTVKISHGFTFFGFEHSRSTPPALSALGGQTLETSFHRIDIGKICRDRMVAATLAGQQMKAAARKSAGGARAAEMDDGGKILLLFRARPNVALGCENCCDIAVEEYRRQFDGIAWHDPGVEAVEPAALVDDGVPTYAIVARLGKRGIGHLIHADGAGRGLVDRERVPGQPPTPVGARNRITVALHLRKSR